MAEIQDNGGGKKGKGSKQKKMAVRVDFTPMVDMNMLLITFFMLCTSLSKPQTMEISMPLFCWMRIISSIIMKASRTTRIILL